jgi:hypothetical protein
MFKIIFRKGKFSFVPINAMGNGLLVLLGMPSAIHILTAALNIKKGDPNRGKKALAIARKVSSNSWVIIGIGTLTVLFADIAAFNNSTGKERKRIWNDINNTLKNIMGQFQSEMRADPVNAREICESGGFSVRGVYKKQEQVFSVTQGNDSGTVDMIGNTCDTTHCHDWFININGSRFVRMKPTTDSKKQARNLKPGNRYGFQHQLITPEGEDDGPLQTLYLQVI